MKLKATLTAVVERRLGRFGGTVRSHAVRVGQAVRKGDAVLHIESRDLMEAQLRFRDGTPLERKWARLAMTDEWGIDPAITAHVKRTGRIPDRVALAAEWDGVISYLAPIDKAFGPGDALFEIARGDKLLAELDVKAAMNGSGAPFALVVDIVEPVSGQSTVGALQPVRDWSKTNPLRTIAVDYRPSSPAISEGAAVEIGLRAQPRALEKPRTAMSGFERGLPYRKKLREQAAAESRGKPVAVPGNPFLTPTTAGRPASGGTAGDLASRQAPAQLPPAAYIPPNDVEAEMAVAGAIFGLRKPEFVRVRERAAPLLVHRAGCSAGEARARITATIESMARRGALCKDSANIVRLDGSKLLPGHKPAAAVVEAHQHQGPHKSADIRDGGHE